MITTTEIEHKLDFLYSHGFDGYSGHLETVKGLGYRVFRDSKGRHKIKMNPNYLNEVFGGIFGGRQ